MEPTDAEIKSSIPKFGCLHGLGVFALSGDPI